MAERLKKNGEIEYFDPMDYEVESMGLILPKNQGTLEFKVPKGTKLKDTPKLWNKFEKNNFKDGIKEK